MMASLVLDQFADLTCCPPALADQVEFRTNKQGQSEAVFPRGMIFHGEHAVALCRTGQATPADDECAAAVGLTKDRLLALQVGYRMDTLGIHSQEHRALYRAGVILGYDENKRLIPGPKWEAYQAAKQKREAGDESE